MMAASGVTEQDIVLNVTAGSVIVVATIAMSNSTAAVSAATTLQATDQTYLSSLLGVAIERVGSVRTYVVTLEPPLPPPSSTSSTSLTVGAQSQAQSSGTSQQNSDLIVPLLIAVLILLVVLLVMTGIRWAPRGRMSVRRAKRSDAPAGSVSSALTAIPVAVEYDSIALSNRTSARIEADSRRS